MIGSGSPAFGQAPGCDAAAVRALKSYVASRPAGSGIVVRNGVTCTTWGNVNQRYDIKSAAKSVGSVLVGVALLDRKLTLDTKVASDVPQILKVPAKTAGWQGQVSYRQLATHTAGFTKPGDEGSITTKPGSRWSYSDGGMNWVADGLTSIYRQDLQSLAFSKVFTAIGIDRSDLVWRRNAYRSATLAGVARREFGSGISITPDAMARIGRLFVGGGAWGGRQLIDRAFTAAAGKPQASTVNVPPLSPGAAYGAPKHYGIMWWTNGDGSIAGVPRDAFWAWGLGEAVILVVPSLDLTVARAGKAWQKGWSPDYRVVAPFFQKAVAVAR